MQGAAGKNRYSSVGSIGRTIFSMNAISLVGKAILRVEVLVRPVPVHFWVGTKV